MARRGWGSIRRRGQKLYAQFVHPRTRADTMRLLRRPDGKPCRTLAEAETALRVLRRQVEGDAEAAQAPPAALTLEQWFGQEYALVLASRLTAGSMRATGAHVERLSRWCRENGDPTMDRIDRGAAERFVAALISEGLRPGYVARLVTTLRRAWKDAATRHLVTANPWQGLRVVRGAQREVPWIEPEQLAALYAATNATQRNLVTLLGETGLRLGEGLALTWADVTLRRPAHVHVRSGKTPSARRTVPLTRAAVRALRAEGRGEDSSLVFSARTPYGVLTAVRRACARAKLPRLRVHDLRHLMASHLVRAGTPVPTVAAILGHSDGGALVLRLYGRWAPRDAQEMAIQRLEAFRSRPRATRGTPTPGRTTPDRPSGPGCPPGDATPRAESLPARSRGSGRRPQTGEPGPEEE